MTNIAFMPRVDRRATEFVLPKLETPTMIGNSAAMTLVTRTLERVARSSMTVLLNGETGTGKELAARAIHKLSPRAENPFIAINTAAIPRDLLESELFGHERGAFTGATVRRVGRFAQADGGSLFLDEIGDMPIELQTRLLRVLSDGEFYPVGASTPIKVDVRIIAATHQNLEERVADGRFREDLFHRLNVIRIRLPALRERREDIPHLLKHYLRNASEKLADSIKHLTPETESYLTAYHWPGNIRQLENVCDWLTVMTTVSHIQLSDLPPELITTNFNEELKDWQNALSEWVILQLKSGQNDVAKQAQNTLEKVLIENALAETGGHRYLAAKRLGYSRNTLTRKIKELALLTND